MDEKACVATMAFGMEAIAGGTDLLAVGEMGIGNTTVAAAIYTALYGGPAELGRPRHGRRRRGLSAQGRGRRGGLARHGDHLDGSARGAAPLGGREVAAIAGAILGRAAAAHPGGARRLRGDRRRRDPPRHPPLAIDHCIAGHLSAEGAHQEVLERLGKIPLLALGMRLGEGIGRGARRRHREGRRRRPSRHGDLRAGGSVRAPVVRRVSRRSRSSGIIPSSSRSASPVGPGSC